MSHYLDMLFSRNIIDLITIIILDTIAIDFANMHRTRFEETATVITVYNAHVVPEEFAIFLKIPMHQKCYFLK